MKRRLQSWLGALLVGAWAGASAGCWWTTNEIVVNDGTGYIQCGGQRFRVHLTIDPADTPSAPTPYPVPPVRPYPPPPGTQPYAAPPEQQGRSAVEQQNFALLSKVHDLETSVQEKDHALAQSNSQIESASREMARAREELQHLKQDVSTLRDRLTAAEKDNVSTLQSIVSSLEAGTKPGVAPANSAAEKPPATP